jgi:hypothetical protein
MNASDPTPAPRSGLASLALVVLTALILLAGWKLPPGWNFLAILTLMTLSLVVLGQSIVGRPLGVLINEQNLVSVSRLQMIVWTVAVLAAYFTYALARMKAGTAAYPDPLAVAIDWHLWALMGISTTSFVSAAVISTTKRDKEPDADVTKITAQNLGEDSDRVEFNREGILYANEAKTDARFTDVFQGNEMGDTTHIDLAKVQMFYFTVISAVAFVVMIAKSLRSGDVSKLPELPDGLIAILGISHAGYLTGQSVTKTPLKTPPPR